MPFELQLVIGFVLGFFVVGPIIRWLLEELLDKWEERNLRRRFNGF